MKKLFLPNNENKTKEQALNKQDFDWKCMLEACFFADIFEICYFAKKHESQVTIYTLLFIFIIINIHSALQVKLFYLLGPFKALRFKLISLTANAYFTQYTAHDWGFLSWAI